MKLLDSYQQAIKDKKIPFSVFLFLIPFISVLLFIIITEGDSREYGFLNTYFFTYLIIYLVPQGIVNLIVWILYKIRGEVYKMQEYEVVLLIPILGFYFNYGMIYTSIFLVLTIFIYWLYLGEKKEVEKTKEEEPKQEVKKKIKDEKQEEIEKTDKKTKEKTSEKYNSLVDELTKLGDLKEKGLLTEEEFNEQKKKLLKQ
jgi:hypothetical protein